MQKKKWQTGILGIGICLCSSVLPTEAAALDLNAANASRIHAVELARAGSYQESLEILEKLAAAGCQDNDFWADYVTILSWAGMDAKVIEIAEQHYGNDFSSLPDYAALPLAESYYRQIQFAKGNAVLLMLKNRGSAEGTMAYAEALARQGERQEAEKIYQEILARHEKAPYEVALSRAILAMERNDFIAAEKYFAQTKNEAPADLVNYSRDIDARRAAMYIQRRENDRAVIILKPYVETGQATPNMLSDYLTALRFDNKQQEAETVFKTYCTDWQEMPLYGLQNMGDLYLRAGRFKEADEIYKHIMSRGDIGWVQLGHAYCLAKQGNDEAALKQYEEILVSHPELTNAVANDADTYIRQQNIRLARKIYASLGSSPEEKARYQLRYADMLSAVSTEDLGNPSLNFQRDEALNGYDYYHEAQDIYHQLAAKEDTALAAKAGMAKNDALRGLYATAKDEIKEVEKIAPDAPETYKAQSAMDDYKQFSLHGFYNGSLDYKRNRGSEIGYELTGYYDWNLYGSSSLTYHRLEDEAEKASYTKRHNALIWQHKYGQASIFYDRYNERYDADGLGGGFTFELNDLATVSYETGHRPHEAAGALRAGIDERYHAVRYEQKVNPKLNFGLEYEWTKLSDDNKYRNYGVDGSYILSTGKAFRDKLLFNYSYGKYDKNSDFYDSPYRSINYSAGFSRKWFVPKHERTWEWITNLGWGRDDQESWQFAPRTRLEFAQNLPADQQLVLGFEYNWRQNNDDDERYRHNGYVFDINYYMEW